MLNGCSCLHRVFATGVIVSGLLTPGILRATTTFVTGLGAANGSERCVTGASQNGGTCGAQGAYNGLESMVQLFADAQGATLTRIDDTDDELWQVVAPGAGVFAIGRSASRNFALVTIPGSGPGASTQVLAPFPSNAFRLPSIPTGQNGNGDLSVVSGYYDASGRPASFAPVSQSGDFQFAIQQLGGTDLWSSEIADNPDGQVDHMVTWQLSNSYLTANHLFWYIAAFENAASPGSDRDFNDYVFLLQNVDPVSGVPEPATIVLIGFALIGLAAVRRFRKAQ